MRETSYRWFALHVAGVLATVSLVCLVAGCSSSPGRPRPGSETKAPGEILDFDALYAANCAGCHGADGRGGAAIALANPVYLALVNETIIRQVTARGVPHTAMPAFAQSSGGMLTDKQVDVLVSGILARWGKPGILAGANPPPYATGSPGDPSRGALAYQSDCQSCHGPDGRGGAKASSITDDSFLALISDQGLRTVVITGRPELGAPDWRADNPGKPLSDQDVTDVVAWLVSRRSHAPGQPYPAAKDAQQH